MNLVALLIGLALVALFCVPWYRATQARSLFVLPWYSPSGKSAPTGFGCLAQALFWLGVFVTLTASMTQVFEGVNAAYPPEERRTAAMAITRSVFGTQDPKRFPTVSETLIEFVRVLSQWNLLVMLGLYGVAFRITFERILRSSVDDKQLSRIMTGVTYLGITLLIMATGSTLLGIEGLGEELAALASERERIFVPPILFWFFIIGLSARFIAAPLSGWTPSFASFVQAASQFWIYSAVISHGFLARWPGLLFILTWLVGAKVFISLTEAVIKKMIPARAVLTTTSLSGLVVVVPICVYAAWIRLANGL